MWTVNRLLDRRPCANATTPTLFGHFFVSTRGLYGVLMPIVSPVSGKNCLILRIMRRFSLRIEFRPTGRVAIIVAATALAMISLADIVAPPVVAQAALTFDRPAAQGPGTQGGGVLSDPTIQPFTLDGTPAPILALASLELQ